MQLIFFFFFLCFFFIIEINYFKYLWFNYKLLINSWALVYIYQTFLQIDLQKFEKNRILSMLFRLEKDQHVCCGLYRNSRYNGRFPFYQFVNLLRGVLAALIFAAFSGELCQRFSELAVCNSAGRFVPRKQRQTDDTLVSIFGGIKYKHRAETCRTWLKELL